MKEKGGRIQSTPISQTRFQSHICPSLAQQDDTDASPLNYHYHIFLLWLCSLHEDFLANVSKPLPQWMCSYSFLTTNEILNEFSPPAPKSLKSNITSFQQRDSTYKRSKCFPLRISILCCWSIAVERKKERGWELKGEGQHIQNCKDAFLSYMASGGKTTLFQRFLLLQAIVTKQINQTAPLTFIAGCWPAVQTLGMQQFQQVFVGNETKWPLFFLRHAVAKTHWDVN